MRLFMNIASIWKFCKIDRNGQIAEVIAYYFSILSKTGFKFIVKC